MKYFEKTSEIPKEELKRKFNDANKELSQNLTKKITNHISIGGGVGAALGTLFTRKRPVLGAIAGAGIGLYGGFMSGAVAGGRGKKSREIRKKYFGTDDLNKIRKREETLKETPHSEIF